MEAINITAYPSDMSQIVAIKAVMKVLKMSKEKPYNLGFVAKIQRSRQDYKDGNFVTVGKENFKAFLGLE